jgi:hypothetical protein
MTKFCVMFEKGKYIIFKSDKNVINNHVKVHCILNKALTIFRISLNISASYFFKITVSK